MSLARAGLVLFGLVALTAGAASLSGIFDLGGPIWVLPVLLTIIALSGVAFLFGGLLEARGRARALQDKTTELHTLTDKLEASLRAVSGINERLHESEARYKGLVDAQGDAIFRRAPDSRLTYGNDAFFRLFGLEPLRAIGHAFAPELHPESRAPFFGSFAGLETGRVRARYDQYVRTVYGWRWIAWEDYAVRDTQGVLIEIQSVGRDVTERKALEDALTDARDKAEAASRAKSGFLATMSHEIRTPMNGVLGMARLLHETPLAPEQRTYVEAIRQSGESLLSLIEDILDFSKIESGTLTLDEDEVEPRAIVEGVVELLAPRAHAKGIEIVSVIAPATPNVVLADSVRVRQILTNLVGNAVKFTETGGIRIGVTEVAGRDRRHLVFEVRDTGVGVPEEKRKEIFNDFVQADSTHARRFGGSGLGLAISKRLVSAMGGDIGVDPAPSGGSVFWFALPVIVIREASENAKLDGNRVAIVTHNPVLLEGMSAQIRIAGGQMVALSYRQAFDETKPLDADAVLIDAGTRNEIELARWPHPSTRALVLLTPGARGNLGALRGMGFAGYLVKPIRQSSLWDRIRATALNSEMALGVRGDMAASSSIAALAPPQSTHTQRALKVLLAEDNAVNALVTREFLRRRGHTVRVVPSGEAAIAALAEEQFDVLLTDIHMPGLDGIEAARRIRQNELENGRARTPIIAVTADALETGKEACQDAGMDGFLTKPIDPAEIDSMFASLFPDKTGSHEAAA